MQSLGTLGGSWSTGLAINNAGQVTGYSEAAYGASHAFIATPISLLYARLLKSVTSVGPGTSLADKVRQALAYYHADDGAATCAMLEGFVDHVGAQSGKKIKQSTAVRLIADAKEIQSAISCS